MGLMTNQEFVFWIVGNLLLGATAKSGSSVGVTHAVGDAHDDVSFADLLPAQAKISHGIIGREDRTNARTVRGVHQDGSAKARSLISQVIRKHQRPEWQTVDAHGRVVHRVHQDGTHGKVSNANNARRVHQDGSVDAIAVDQESGSRNPDSATLFQTSSSTPVDGAVSNEVESNHPPVEHVSRDHEDNEDADKDEEFQEKVAKGAPALNASGATNASEANYSDDIGDYDENETAAALGVLPILLGISGVMLVCGCSLIAYVWKQLAVQDAADAQRKLMQDATTAAEAKQAAQRKAAERAALAAAKPVSGAFTGAGFDPAMLLASRNAAAAAEASRANKTAARGPGASSGSAPYAYADGEEPAAAEGAEAETERGHDLATAEERKKEKAEAAEAAMGPPETYPRLPQPNQSICLILKAEKGQNMPNVGTFGGCSPFLEFRCVFGKNPSDEGEQGLERPSVAKVQTESISNSLDPVWDTIVDLGPCSMKDDCWLQVLLWSYSMAGNTVIGQYAQRVDESITGMQYTPEDKTVTWRPSKATFQKVNPSIVEELTSTADFQVGYAEILRFTMTIVRATKVPKVDFMGGKSDPLVEARVVRGDPGKKEFVPKRPGADVLWSARTDKKADDVDPHWEAEMMAKFANHEDAYLQFALLDDNGPLPDTVIGHAVLPIRKLVKVKPGAPPYEHQLKLSQVPMTTKVPGIKDTKLFVKIGYELVFEE